MSRIVTHFSVSCYSSLKLLFFRPTICCVLIFSLTTSCSKKADIYSETTSTPSIQVSARIPTPTPYYNADFLKRLSPDDILAQLTYQPGRFRPEAVYNFGWLPEFTLYADGRVIYLDSNPGGTIWQVLEGHLTRLEIIQFMQQMLNAGFLQLESYTDICKPIEDGSSLCLSDARTETIKLRSPSGELREIQIYAEFTDVPEVLQSVNDIMLNFAQESAQQYSPEKAVLFIRELRDVRLAGVQKWQLNPRLLLPKLKDKERWAIVIQGDELSNLLSAVDGNLGEYYFAHNSQYYQAFLVPWLPGIDFSNEVGRTFPPRNLETKINLLDSFSSCTASSSIKTERTGSFHLVYYKNDELWALNETELPVLLLKAKGIEQLKLAQYGNRVIFVQRTAEGIYQLGTINITGGEKHSLSNEYAGRIHFIALSPDESLLAFLHMLDEYNAELWVADLNSMITRRLVSIEDLRISAGYQPGLIGVIPTAVQWIPASKTLLYAVYSIYDGLSVYVQDQVYQVDAISGRQGIFLEAGKGGIVVFSPSGSLMVVLTLSSMNFMNINTMEQTTAGLNYSAIGMGESYHYPYPVWKPNSASLLVALPTVGDVRLDGKNTIWEVPVDGSPATQLASLYGNASSVSFSPDLQKVAYWYAEPMSNARELYIYDLISNETIFYDIGYSLFFDGWAPDAHMFSYSVGDHEIGRTLLLGDYCSKPIPLQPEQAIARWQWLDASRALLLKVNEVGCNLYLRDVSEEMLQLAENIDCQVYDYRLIDIK